MYYGRGRERESSAFIVAICCDYCKATRNVFARQIIYWFLRGKRKILIIPTDSDVRIVSTCSDDRQTLSGTRNTTQHSSRPAMAMPVETEPDARNAIPKPNCTSDTAICQKQLKSASFVLPRGPRPGM